MAKQLTWKPRKKAKLTADYSLLGLPIELEFQIFSSLYLDDILRSQFVNKFWLAQVVNFTDRLVCNPHDLTRMSKQQLFNLTNRTDGKQIRYVGFSYIEGLRTNTEYLPGLLQLGKLTNLEVLRLHGLSAITNKEGNQIFSRMTKLVYLNIQGTYLPNFKLDRWITKMVRLQCFAYRSTYFIEPDDMARLYKSLSFLPNLTALHVMSAKNFNLEDLSKHLPRCSSLRSLTLDNITVEIYQLECVTKITQITQLNYWGDGNRSLDYESPTWMSKLTFLKSYLNRTEEIQSTDIITFMTHLEDLYLYDWTESDLVQLRTSMPNLTALTLEFGSWNDATKVSALQELKGIPLLQIATSEPQFLTALISTNDIKIVNCEYSNGSRLQQQETSYIGLYNR